MWLSLCGCLCLLQAQSQSLSIESQIRLRYGQLAWDIFHSFQNARILSCAWEAGCFVYGIGLEVAGTMTYRFCDLNSTTIRVETKIREPDRRSRAQHMYSHSEMGSKG